MKLVVALGLISLFGFSAQAAQQAEESLSYLNNLRAQAGLIALTENQVLQKAAQGHANYLSRHRLWGHEQRRGKAGFTGVTPLDRMLAAGYRSRHNSENVSSHSGSASPVKSVNGLMSAIYHRFGFLSFDYNEIGVGYKSDQEFHSYVYDMGNSNKAALCSGPAVPVTSGQYIFKVCAEQKRQIKKAVFEKALTDIQLKNAAVVVWPPVNGRKVPPAFYDEEPDPLPAYDVSGYPVSVQFNPVFFNNNIPRVTRFELYRLADNSAVEIIAQFDSQTDPNKKFTAYEHAVFPKHRLDWDSEYRAEVDYLTPDGKKHALNWTFRTAGFDMPYYQVKGGELINEKQETFGVYSPPLSNTDAKSEFQVSYRGFKDIKVTILDAHTLIITPVGKQGQATFDFHGKQFKVVR